MTGASSRGQIRVLALTRYTRQGASSRMRTFQYREPLAAHGVEFDIQPLFGDAYLQSFYRGGARLFFALKSLGARLRALHGAKAYDAVWVEKEALPWLPAIFELSLLPRGVPLIADYDDAIFHRYDQNRRAAVRLLLGRKLDKVMRRASLVIAGNPYLARHAQAAGARRVEVVPTVIDLERYPLRAVTRSDPLTVGWIGTPNTMEYLEALKPMLRALSVEVPMRVAAIGARPDQMQGDPFEASPWSEEGEVDALRTFDIGVMPLPDTPWERGKCGYKLIQYMALGLPVVASPVGVNTEIVQDGVNGFLAADEDAWKRALGALAADGDMRKAFGEAGRRLVEQHYTLQVQAPRLARLITEVVRGRS